ncbi:hypothetical protein FHETE_5334 [Fusarium heterosporum]|uniref:Uncharacterized protein n=1 Tax=Fusarium heterosporum TaxID=42747 RepID=A0A8H5TEE7_FUSHE|nr:hypothetical protein FHETE_5334 [Fusarium heterosporum]
MGPGLPDPTKIDPCDINARRAFIEAYFKDDGRFVPADLERRYIYSVKGMAQRFHDAGFLEVSHPYFEYMVDQGVWVQSFAALKNTSLGRPWPWGAKPSISIQRSQVFSQAYRQWRIDNGHPVKPQPTPTAAPVQEIASNDNADTAAPTSAISGDTDKAPEPGMRRLELEAQLKQLAERNQKLEKQLEQSNRLVQLLGKQNLELSQQVMELSQQNNQPE